MAKIYCANNNTLYSSAKEAALDLGLNHSQVSRALHGHRPRAGVYLLSFVDDDPTEAELNDLRRWLLYSVYKINLKQEV